jgi:hypothetical protein
VGCVVATDGACIEAIAAIAGGGGAVVAENEATVIEDTAPLDTAVVDDLAATASTDYQICEDNAGHIFSAKHLIADTLENRQLLMSTANNPANYVSTNSTGVQTFRQMLPDGTQAWAEVFDGEIKNGGINRVPR